MLFQKHFAELTAAVWIPTLPLYRLSAWPSRALIRPAGGVLRPSSAAALRPFLQQRDVVL